MDAKAVHMFPAWDMTRYLPVLARELGELGWDVTASDRGGLLQALVRGDAIVHIHWTEGLTPNRSLKDALFAWCCLPLIWLAARRVGVVWTIHNYEPHEGYAPLVGRRYHRILARCVSALIVHRESTREAAAGTYGRGCTIYVTPQASFNTVHGEPVDRESAREALGLAPGRLVFAQLGQLRRYKLPVEAIRAFRSAGFDDAELLVAGRCSDPDLEREIREAGDGATNVDVTFGYLDDDQLVARIAAADWLIAPYRAIENPTALELAVAYDRPVIAPDLPAVREALNGHPHVLYDHQADAEGAIAHAIQRAVAGEAVSGDDGARTTTWSDQARATACVYESIRRGTRVGAAA